MTTFLVLLISLIGISARPQTPSPTPSCTLSSPCSFSTNISWDSKGEPDTRPGTWGLAAAYTVPIPFQNIPAGYRVRILKLYGDVVAWPHGKIEPGTFAGILSGLQTTTPDTANNSPFIDTHAAPLAQKDCFLYVQGTVGAQGLTRIIDVPHVTNGLLNEDGVMNLKQAVWLNETGVSIHMETTLMIDFAYEAK